MKDHTINNANPSLPPQWNDCTTCNAGITRKTDPTQHCRKCNEAATQRVLRDAYADLDQLAREIYGGYGFGRNNSHGEWSYGDSNCSSTGAWG